MPIIFPFFCVYHLSFPSTCKSVKKREKAGAPYTFIPLNTPLKICLFKSRISSIGYYFFNDKCEKRGYSSIRGLLYRFRFDFIVVSSACSVTLINQWERILTFSLSPLNLSFSFSLSFSLPLSISSSLYLFLPLSLSLSLCRCLSLCLSVFITLCLYISLSFLCVSISFSKFASLFLSVFLSLSVFFLPGPIVSLSLS